MKKINLSIMIITLMIINFSCSNSSKNNAEIAKDTLQTKDTIEEKIEIIGEEVSYQADSITMNGYIAYDQSKTEKRPGILVVHEWWGHNDYARKRADMLAEIGYVAMAVDMYGDGLTAGHPDDAGAFAGKVMSDINGAKQRFLAAMETLKSNPNVDQEQIGAIGYCFGGGIVLHMARFGVDLDGVVSFHGSLGTKTPAENGDIKSKILVLHGADDPFVPEEAIENFKNEMTNAGADMEFIAYEGAVHAFTNPDASELGKKFELPLAYDEEADKESWNKMTEFFNTIFK